MFSRRTQWNLATNRYTQALEQFRGSGRTLLDLTASNPTKVGLSFQEDTLSAALRHSGNFSYDPAPRGLLAAREAISGYYAEKGIAVPPDDLILTTSTSEAYSFVFRLLCDPDDAVLVPAPSYPLFEFLADINDLHLAPYELVYDHGWQMDKSAIQASIAEVQKQGRKARAILLVHPNNPTGSYTKTHEIKWLSQFCREEGLALIADEVFLDYKLESFSPPTFAANQEALTFTLSGLSKVSALPQMKVAWVVVSGHPAPKSEALSRLEIIADTYLSMNTPIQLAVPAMLEERHNIQPQLLSRIRENLAVLDQALAPSRHCSRLAIEGGWYAVLRVPALGSDEDLVIDILNATGVLLQPGHFYDFPNEGYLVASLITPLAEFRAGILEAVRWIDAR